ncbi:PREDICTED: myc box-dependent-interacting protein 1 isoform X1 [Nicrophorus vespilloides]|uniref:Myc box-dependent-interacting protein 1 isoform X1 n=1 Tax=Nicrophorus vespilloides TaxID=110193 RepID=A0ABM1MZZ0_NICVS|nr:PREDICTED: myc box-dependent-interacting protein 1 isoform X1 [Nicrophorus vespilloides]
MAESRSSLLAKSVQKHAGRAKEKILQNLGKVDRTADDIFDDHLLNFNKQQNNANRLQKEFNNYIRCVRAAQLASKQFMEAVSEVYETGWSGHDLLYVQTQSVDMLYQDFCHKLGEQVLIPLNTYQNQFPEMKKKIEKRGRKLVDYDGQRHNYQTLQSGMAKKKDETKLSKGREQLEEAKRTYEVLNSELHDEIPALYDSRILFLVTNLQTLFNTEQIFHAETAKVYSELEAIVDKLATDSQRASYSLKKTNGSSLPRKPPTAHSNDIVNATSTITMNSISPIKNNSLPEGSTNSSGSTTPTALATTPTKPHTPPPQVTTPKELFPPQTDATSAGSGDEQHSGSSSPSTPEPPLAPATLKVSPPMETTVPKPETHPPRPDPPKPEVNGNSITTTSLTTSTNSTTTTTSTTAAATTTTTQVPPSTVTNDNVVNVNKVTTENANKVRNVEELYDIPVGASTENLPHGVLYRVKSTYKYTREDVDELSFDVGEIIRVIEYDDPEEQEEGWLMGLKETTGERGMFPANFTKPL